MQTVKFDAIERLCSEPAAFRLDSRAEALFVEAMRENYAWQLERQPYLRHLAQRAGIRAEDLHSGEDLWHIPPLAVGAMKHHAFQSVPESELAMVLTSSGTGGQRTQSFFDAGSLRRLEDLSLHAFREVGWASERPVHYLVFNYDRTRATDVGTAWSAEQKTRMAPAASIDWLIQWDPARGEFGFDVDRWVKRLLELPEGDPVRFVGFPAFISRFVEELLRRAPSYRVHPDSFVIAGGGWKNHAGRPMTHQDFAHELETRIGLPAANVRDTYGMAEHGVPYPACRCGRHHVPIYARVAVVEPLSLRRLPLGEEGLLQLLTPFNTAQANLSVLSTDLARLAEGCACGIPGLYLASIRRGGLRKHKGCAIAAQAILDRTRS